MKKKLTLLILPFLLCLAMGMSVPASQTEDFADQYERVLDMAGLLTDNEVQELIRQLDEISIRQSMDVVVVTTDDLEGYGVADYADDLYDQCEFGYGSTRDGLLLLISMEDRDWYISTCGEGIRVFTDAGIQYIGDQILSELSQGNYAAAFQRYGELCDDFITQARDEQPYDSNHLPREPLSLIWIPASIGIGLVLALIIVGVMIGKLKTVRAQATADSYVKQGSLSMKESRDRFLYHTVTKTAKPKENSSSGSSTHTSSSGTTHGGGGGKF